MDVQRINGATPDIIKKWFELPVLLAIKDIQWEERYNIDEIGITEGIGSNGLCVGSARTNEV